MWWKNRCARVHTALWIDAPDCRLGSFAIASDDMEALERRAGDGVEKDSSTNDPGSLYDFVQFVNQTVGKHFKCCICLRYFYTLY